MLEALTEPLKPSRTETLAKAFSRWGRSGFWALVVMGALPRIIMVCTFVFTGRPTGSARCGLPLVQFLQRPAPCSWVPGLVGPPLHPHRRAPSGPETRPSDASLRGPFGPGWGGRASPSSSRCWCCCLEVGTLLSDFLSAPQAGVPTVQTTGAAVATWVSVVDMMNLLSVILTLGGEIFALIFGLLLLFRTLQLPAQSTEGSEAHK